MTLLKLLLTCLVLTSVTAAEDWSFVEKDGEYRLISPKGIQSPVFVDVGEPKIEEVKPLGSDHLQVIYYAGSVGTSKLVAIRRAAVVSLREEIVMGVYPYSYSDRKADEQPVWKVEENILSVYDPDVEQTQTLSLR